MKKQKAKVGSFYEETWGQNVYLLSPATAEDLASFAKVEFGAEYKGSEGFIGRCLHIPSSNGGQIVIGLRQWDNGPVMLGTLTHECFHAVEYILSVRGMRHCNATSEAYAYLLGSLVRNCLRTLNSRKAMRTITKR